MAIQINPPIVEPHKNWHEKHQETLKVGDRIADKVARFIGSWRGIITSNIFVVIWITFNVVYINGIVDHHWDKYPFILLNLIFSWQAYNSAPLIMMAQNRQADKDKIQAQHQYEHQEQELKLQTKILYEQNEMLEEIRSRE